MLAQARFRALGFVLGALMAGATVAAAHDEAATARKSNAYTLRILVVNDEKYAQPGVTQIVDPLLVNPWGSAIRAAGLGGHFWLANQGTNTVTEYVGDVYDANGNFVPLHQDQNDEQDGAFGSLNWIGTANPDPDPD